MLENLGLTLKLLRERKGWDQTRLGEAARLYKSQISKYERGVDVPKLDGLSRLVQALDLDLSSFFSIVRAIDDASGSRDLFGPPPRFKSIGEPHVDEAFRQLLSCLVDLHRVCGALGLLRPLDTVELRRQKECRTV